MASCAWHPLEGSEGRRGGKFPSSWVSREDFLAFQSRELVSRLKNPSRNQINEKISHHRSGDGRKVGGEAGEGMLSACQNDSWSRTSYINAITELMACYFIQFTKSSYLMPHFSLSHPSPQQCSSLFAQSFHGFQWTRWRTLLSEFFSRTKLCRNLCDNTRDIPPPLHHILFNLNLKRVVVVSMDELMGLH